MNKKTDYRMVEKYSVLVDDFVIDYKRVPTEKEFVELGGYLPFILFHFGTLKEFYSSLGYGKLPTGRKNLKKFFVIDTKRNNKLIATKNIDEIAKMFSDKTRMSLHGAIYHKHLVKGRYRILKSLDEVANYE